MNVNSTTSQSLIGELPPYNQIVPGQGEASEDEGRLPQQPMPTHPTDPLAGIQSQFASLLQSLSRELSALENQLMQALKQITGGPQPPPNREDEPNAPGSGQRLPHQPFQKIVCDAAERHEVDPLLVNAVIGQESGFQPNAVSKTGARGLMQLMPDTARSLGVNDPFNPRQNVEGGTTLLRQLLDRYNGQLDLALAAYNAGPAAVDKYGGVPPFPETQSYVKNVLASYKAGTLSASPA